MRRLLLLTAALTLLTTVATAQHRGSVFRLDFFGVASPATFVPGHFETRCEKVWVPGEVRRVWVEPQYRCVTDPCGRTYTILVAPGYWRADCEPGRYEFRERQVWVEGYWEQRRRGRC